jgi:hypothetical protein
MFVNFVITSDHKVALPQNVLSTFKAWCGRHDFWTNSSKVISKNSHFLYLRTSRWRCAETLHVASGHACDDIYQDWFEYDKALWRYRLMSVFATATQNLCARLSKTIWQINLICKIFCQHGLKMIWFNFRANRTNRLGRVRKSRFFGKLKMAGKLSWPKMTS